MGTGWIVERFVASLRRHSSQQFVALSSRDGSRAREAAARLDVPRAHGSYEGLAADPHVDVVYVGTGHADHVSCARIAVEAGKHVLVEKPLGRSAAEADELVRLAEARGVFCAEALWTFYLPRFDVVRQVLDSGMLGDVHTVLADIGEYLPPEHRIYRPELSGGPMLDLGTYPFAFATWVLGVPDQVLAAQQPHPSGVHGQLGAVLTASGRQAVVHTTVFGDTPTTATISGTRATLTLPGRFYQPGDVLLTPAGGGPVRAYREEPIAHDGLFHEAVEVARCVAAGQAQTPLRPLADSLATLRTMDAVRSRCGIVFPGEAGAGADPT